MSEWQIKNEAFVWTAVRGDAYQLFLFNQSSKGIYVVTPNGDHLSIHSEGYSCHRLNGIPDFPFQLPAIADMRIHLAQTVYTPLFDELILQTCRKINTPLAGSRSLFVELERLPIGKYKLVLETWFYEAEASADMPHLVRLRPFELITFQEYQLDAHRKLLGVYVYRSNI